MAVNLSLSAATVRMIAEKARAASASVPDSYEDGHEGNVNFDPDAATLQVLPEGLAEEAHDDYLDEELVELMSDLNIDESAELVAITWIGRGDYDAADFAEAVLQAKERATGSAKPYLLGLPHFPDHLENGLNELGV
ncbi:DUF3775 domain-containing protein [Polycladidibacter hongkongensis]|uniref:DUF3775 domain-containing protein n=1 Tax=Polycladidibacter hongkongensis TaxID=1647556 RepID=UPI00083172BE|nr:DUF3775 domain-containing protein [Pseudovibrio hongkongensis]